MMFLLFVEVVGLMIEIVVLLWLISNILVLDCMIERLELVLWMMVLSLRIVGFVWLIIWELLLFI